ncbi:hypothetical protein D3C76_852160 [compost metagenome]
MNSSDGQTTPTAALMRGVFTSQQEKEQTIPALTLSLLKPTEFVELQQLYTAKKTAPETKQTNRAVTQHLIKHFKAQGQISEKAKVRQIRFCDFTNVNRFDYLLGLTKYGKYATVSFEEVADKHSVS